MGSDSSRRTGLWILESRERTVTDRGILVCMKVVDVVAPPTVIEDCCQQCADPIWISATMAPAVLGGELTAVCIDCGMPATRGGRIAIHEDQKRRLRELGLLEVAERLLEGKTWI